MFAKGSVLPIFWIMAKQYAAVSQSARAKVMVQYPQANAKRLAFALGVESTDAVQEPSAGAVVIWAPNGT